MATLTFTDSHCHLDFSEFSTTLAQQLNQCAAAGIKRIIVPSIGPDNWQNVIALSQQHTCAPKLYPALGIHPWYLPTQSQYSLQQLAQLISQHRQQLIAVGEIGLDGKIAKEQGNLSLQIDFFKQQLNLAIQYQLPVIIHQHRAHQEVHQLLRQQQHSQAGIIHGFSGSYQQAKNYLDLGFKLGIGGTISYPRAEKTLNTVKKLPLTSIVLETDAPAMPLYGCQGQANSPLKLLNIFDYLCQIRQESKAHIAEQLESNINDFIASSTATVPRS